MWPENKYDDRHYWTKNDLKLFSEELTPLEEARGKLTEFERDLRKGYVDDREAMIRAQRTDPFYNPDRLKNQVKVPYDAHPADAKDILENARSIDDILTGIGHLIGYVTDLEETINEQGNTIVYLEESLRTLEIEKMGPQGKEGLPGARGPQGPPGEPAPDLHQEVLDAVNEMMETYKDLQEQIDDIAEEL